MFGKREKRKTRFGMKVLFGVLGAAGIAVGVGMGKRMICDKAKRLWSGIRRAMKKTKDEAVAIVE